MTAGRHDFTIEQGATWRTTIEWRDEVGALVPLAGYQARMQARRATDTPEVLVELTTENGRIALASPGVIALTLPAADTAALDWRTAGRSARYDLELVAPDGTVTRLLKGTLSLDPEVTK